jgi:hypothetical protein
VHTAEYFFYIKKITVQDWLLTAVEAHIAESKFHQDYIHILKEKYRFYILG